MDGGGSPSVGVSEGRRWSGGKEKPGVGIESTMGSWGAGGLTAIDRGVREGMVEGSDGRAVESERRPERRGRATRESEGARGLEDADRGVHRGTVAGLDGRAVEGGHEIESGTEWIPEE